MSTTFDLSLRIHFLRIGFDYIFSKDSPSNNSVASNKINTEAAKGTWTKVNDDLLVYLPSNWPNVGLSATNVI